MYAAALYVHTDSEEQSRMDFPVCLPILITKALSPTVVWPGIEYQFRPSLTSLSPILSLFQPESTGKSEQFSLLAVTSIQSTRWCSLRAEIPGTSADMSVDALRTYTAFHFPLL